MTRVAVQAMVALLVLLSSSLGVAQVRFVSDFESGVLNNAEFFSPSQGWKGAGNFPVITEEHARAGRFAMKAYLNKNTSQTPYRTMLQSAWDTTTDPANRVYPHAPHFEDSWIGFSIYLPASGPGDWQVASTNYEVLAQWHDAHDPFPPPPNDTEVSKNPLFSLTVNDTPHPPVRNWHIAILGESRTPYPAPNSPRPYQYESSRNYDLGPIDPDLDKWTDFVVRIRWNYWRVGSTNNTPSFGSTVRDNIAGSPYAGLIQVWKNGVLVVNESPVQIGSNDNAGPVFSVGLYKGWRTAEDRAQDTSVTERLMYFDEFRYGAAATTYADVAPGGGPQWVCGQDGNGDGNTDGAGELAVCLTSAQGPVCPLAATACVAGPNGGPQVCPLDASRPCADDGSGAGRSVCSALQCIDRSTLPPVVGEPPTVPPEDNGPRDAEGNCLGQIEVFAGQAVRCRTGGAQTLYRNCCKNREGVISDSMGGSEIALGGKALSVVAGAAHAAVTGGVAAANSYLAAAFDPTSLAITVAVALIAELLLDQCDEQDVTTALLSSSEYCTELGDYCSEDWPIVGCVQRARRFCCFNSKLARIIQEQARPQLPIMDGFGTPEEPNCRGFTPEEFQAIDFSKIDLSEYYDELRMRSQDLIEEDLRDRAQQTVPP